MAVKTLVAAVAAVDNRETKIGIAGAAWTCQAALGMVKVVAHNRPFVEAAAAGSWREQAEVAEAA